MVNVKKEFVDQRSCRLFAEIQVAVKNCQARSKLWKLKGRLYLQLLLVGKRINSYLVMLKGSWLKQQFLKNEYDKLPVIVNEKLQCFFLSDWGYHCLFLYTSYMVYSGMKSDVQRLRHSLLSCHLLLEFFHASCHSHL